jgi:hypothetical protein
VCKKFKKSFGAKGLTITTLVLGNALNNVITVGNDFLDLLEEKRLYKHVRDYRKLRSYDRLKQKKKITFKI